MRHLILATSLGLMAVVINPSFGCSSPDIDYKFSEADMRAAVAGTYAGSFRDHTETVTLTLDEGVSASSKTPQSTGARQLQCSRSFSFVKPAAACIPTTTMTVSGQVSSSSGGIAASAVSGVFEVHEVTLTEGVLSLTLADGSTISAQFQDGKFSNWLYSDKNGGNYGLDLARR